MGSVKRVEGRPTRDLLAESLPAAIAAIQWPKTMFWTGGKTGFSFHSSDSMDGCTTG